MQFKDEVRKVPSGVPEGEREELFQDAVDHGETVKRAPADQLATGGTGFG